MASAKILVVEDEKAIAEAITYNLQREGYRTVAASDGLKAVELARREQPDLVLLDWMLPGQDGLEVCRALKQDAATRRIPVIMVTVKSSETDKVLGLELGADDYVTKPFSPRELVARVKALLRRAHAAGDAPEVVQVEALQVDRGKHLVFVKGREVEMTSKEFDLLNALLDANGRVLSREALLEKVWGYERSVEIETRTVDLHVSQLRKKLKDMADRIVTVKNIGYRFVRDE